MIRVVLERPEQPASLMVFAQAVVVAGRGADADDATPIDWILPFPDVSRRQCRFSSAGGELFIEGLSERSPTYVNGRKAQGMTRLRPGDAVRFGHCVVRVCEEVAAVRDVATRKATPSGSPAPLDAALGPRGVDASAPASAPAVGRAPKPAVKLTMTSGEAAALAVERPAAAELAPVGEDMSILVERARHWDLRGRPLPLLLSGPLLQRGRSWLRRGPDLGEAGGLVRLFVEASERARRSRLRRMGVAASVTMASVLGGSAAAQVLLPDLLSPELVPLRATGPRECRADALARADALVAAGAQQADDTAALLLTSRALQEADLGGCRNIASAEPTLRELLTKRHSRLLDRREGPIQAVVARRDGQYIAAADASGRITIWDVAGKLPAAPLDSGLPAHVLAWSRDDRWLATGTTAGDVEIWDVSEPTQAVKQRRISEHHQPITALAFSPEGGMLASVDARDLHLWDMGGEAHGDDLGEHKGLTGPTTQLMFNASASRLFGLSDGKVRIWPIAPAGAPERLGKASALPADGRIMTMAVSLSGAQIVTGDAEGLVLAWQLRGGTWKSSAGTTHGGAVVAVQLLPGREAFVSVGSDFTLSLVDFAAARRKTSQPLVYPLGPLQAKPQHLVVDASGRRALTFDEHGVAEVWSLDKLQKQPIVRFSEDRPVTALAGTSQQSVVVTGEENGSLRVWDMMLDGGSAGAHTLTEHRGGVPKIALSREGETLVSSEQGKHVQVWSLDEVVPSSLALIPVKRPVQTLAVSANGRWIAGAANNTIYVWDLEKRKKLDAPAELVEHPETVMHLAFSVGGEWLVSADLKGAVRSWRMTGEGPELTARQNIEHPPKVLALAVSRDHVAVGTGGSDDVRGEVFAWPLGEQGAGDERPVWDHPGSVQRLIFDPSGQHLASGSADGGVKTGVLREERFQVLTPYSHGQSVSALAFKEMPDQRVMLASGALDGEIIVSSPDERDGSPRKLPRHSGKITGLAFGAAPGLLVSVAEDGAALWQLGAKDERRMALNGHRGAIVGLQADVAGRTVVTVGSDQTLRVWPLEVSALQHLVCLSVGRNLRPDELPPGISASAEPQCPAR